jgi:hypothetical protein
MQSVPMNRIIIVCKFSCLYLWLHFQPSFWTHCYMFRLKKRIVDLGDGPTSTFYFSVYMLYLRAEVSSNSAANSLCIQRSVEMRCDPVPYKHGSILILFTAIRHWAPVRFAVVHFSFS